MPLRQLEFKKKWITTAGIQTYGHVPRVELVNMDREVVERREVEEHQARVRVSDPLPWESFGAQEADFGQILLVYGDCRVAGRAGVGGSCPCLRPDARKHRCGRPEVDLRARSDFFSSFKKHDEICKFWRCFPAFIYTNNTRRSFNTSLNKREVNNTENIVLNPCVPRDKPQVMAEGMRTAPTRLFSTTAEATLVSVWWMTPWKTRDNSCQVVY